MNDSKKKPEDEVTPPAAPTSPATVQPAAAALSPEGSAVTDPTDSPKADVVEPVSSEPQTCAACGETAVFTEHSTIGSVALDYHSCADAAALVHDYAVRSIRDREYPLPQLAS